MTRFAAGFIAFSACLGASAHAFTVRAPTQGMGHEFLSVEGARRAGLREPARNEITGESASCRYCDQYGTKNHKTWSAVMGNRWTDLNGYSALTEGKCFDAVAQSSAFVQPAHFLRGANQVGEKGVRQAAEAGIAFIRTWFMRGVSAPMEPMWFRDGGTLVGRFKAIRPYFYLGIALHSLQDGFSEEHTQRDRSFRKILDVSTYVETHRARRHACPKRPRDRHRFGGKVATLPGEKNQKHGDYIFNTTGRTAVDNLKRSAKAAMDATADLFGAFQAARRAPGKAKEIFDAFVRRWMVIAPSVVSYSGPAIAACAPPVGTENRRLACLRQSGTEKFEPNYPKFCWPAKKCSEDALGTVRDAFTKAAKAIAKVTARMLNGLRQVFSGIFRAIGNFANAVVHRLHGYSKCANEHVPALARRSGNEALNKARQQIKLLWADLSRELSFLQPSEREKVARGPWETVRRGIGREVSDLRERGMRQVRTWFGAEAKKGKAAAVLRRLYDDVVAPLQGELEASYKTAMRP